MSPEYLKAFEDERKRLRKLLDETPVTFETGGLFIQSLTNLENILLQSSLSDVENPEGSNESNVHKIS